MTPTERDEAAAAVVEAYATTTMAEARATLLRVRCMLEDEHPTADEEIGCYLAQLQVTLDGLRAWVGGEGWRS